jgi:hypothetical protein
MDQRLRGEATWENNSRLKAQLAAGARTAAQSSEHPIADDLEDRRHALAGKLAAEEERLRASLQSPATAALANRRQNMLNQARQRAIAREELRAQVCNALLAALD